MIQKLISMCQRDKLKMTDKKHFKYPDIERLGSDENKDILFFWRR